MIKSTMWSDFDDKNCEFFLGIILFSKIKCCMLKGNANTYPNFDVISNGMSPINLKHGFEDENFGYDILFAPIVIYLET